MTHEFNYLVNIVNEYRDADETFQTVVEGRKNSINDSVSAISGYRSETKLKKNRGKSTISYNKHVLRLHKAHRSINSRDRFYKKAR